MEVLKLNNITFQQNDLYYINYITNLPKFKDELKKNNKYNDIIEPLDSMDSIKIYFMLIFFQNHDKWLNANFHNNNYNNVDKNNFKEIINYFKIKRTTNDNDKEHKYIFNLFIHWFYYLYLDLIGNIYLVSIPNLDKINIIKYLLKETNLLLVKLYKSNILNTRQIFNILYFYIFLIESNFGVTTHSDNLFQLKNNLLLNRFFSLLQEVTLIILNNINLNNIDENNKKNDVEIIFGVLEILKNNKELNSQRNIIIIINRNYLGNFISSFLKAINVEILSKYEPKFKNKLINFYSQFIKYNFKKSKIFNNIIESLKNSFVNLYYFEKNKEIIANDLFIQAFYIKLIKKVFFFDEISNNMNTPLFNTFFFNGFDSAISLNIENNKSLEKSSLFFSFNILPIDNREIYPLFMIEKDSDKKNNKELLFDIYLKKIKEKETKGNIEEYDLYIFKDDKEIKVDNITKIMSNTNYYFNITFNGNKIMISFYSGKGDIIQFEIDKNKKIFDSNSYNFTFGYKENALNVFSGYIGPIILIKNPPKEMKINDLICIVLKMKSDYQNFIFLSQTSSFSFEYINHFKNNDIINKAKKKLEKIINFECILYLTPDMFSLYKVSPNEKIKKIPDVDSICQSQKYYKINNLNVTLVKHEQGIINFIMDNGLNFICLLYEYIYQFMRNYEENINNIGEYKDLYLKMIISIFKKSLFILEIKHTELNVNNLNKSFKQIHMNLFACLKLISRNYFIINDLIIHFFNIIHNYRSCIFDLIQKKSNIENNNINGNNFNNDILKINLAFFNGWIDILLTQQLYDFKNTKTLIHLFDKLSSYFNFQGEKEASVIINQYFYTKLQNFALYLNNYFEYYESNLIDDENKIEDINNNPKEKKEVLDCYLKALKSFFENNPSKTENIINLKDIFIFINECLEDKYRASLGYYNFINELIGNNPDLFFNDEKDDEQIKSLINYAKKFSKKIINESKDVKDENKINNKKNIFNKLLSIIMRIIFTKKRINNNTQMINEFKKLIQKVDITSDLIISITEEIINIIDYSIGASKNNKIKNKHNITKNDNKDSKEKKEKYYTAQELKYISNFYSEIFNLILYFLEYPINNQNINNIKDVNIYEGKVFELLEIIEGMIKGNIENNNIVEIDARNENDININDDNNGLFTIDTIYCLIYFIKFYNNILFKKLYDEKYINNFINICKLCCTSCLINSNILIEVEDCSKTILEIILDICIYYVTNSTRLFFNPSSFIEINFLKKENVKKEQIAIYNFLIDLFFDKKKDDENKEKKKKNSIFYNNDYLRFISENKNENKKLSKKDLNFLDYPKGYNNYGIINNLLMNEQKFNYNFLTFFLIKLGGYNKNLINLNVTLNKDFPEIRETFKYNDFLKLIVDTNQLIMTENELLLSLNKDYFFKSKKSNSSGYNHYNEVKKRIEQSIKKKEKSEVYNYINDEIYKNDSEIVFNFINSGLCCKKDNRRFSFRIFQGHKRSEDDLKYKTDRKKGILYKGGHFPHSSINLIKDLAKETEDKDIREIQSIKTFRNNKKVSSFKTNSIDDENNSWKEENKIFGGQDEDEYELYFDDDTPSSENNKNNNNLNEIKSVNNGNNNKNNNILLSMSSSPVLFKRDSERKNTEINTSYSMKNLDIFTKNNKSNERSISYFTTSSKESSIFINNNDNNQSKIPYINFFDEPDECYLKNSKKELMMTVFSLHFFNSFFNNNEFELMKYYYLQNFEGIQTSTKMLNYPSKYKNYTNGLEPCLFIKPFSSFFGTKIFPITHQYFYEYMINNNILPKPIILYQKDLSPFNLKNQFENKCELIKVDHNYYGHLIGSKDYNFIIFEEENFKFYEENNNIIKKKKINPDDLDDLFTLSVISKKPLNNPQIKILNSIEKFSFFKGKKVREKKIVIINFNEIEEILERRFLLMWQAIEIYLKNGKSYFFNFMSKEKSKFILDIFKNNNITKDKVHEKDYFRTQKYIISEWVEERLSTYEYLLFLNKYSSRTFHDTNQYPVFPWLITKYSNQTKKNHEYRILKYPMAAQNEDNRITAMNRFEDEEENQNKFPAHFGTHYSTSAYIYYYLMREEPFTTLLVKLQGYKQENPDRMFYSLEEILYVLNLGQDNREMIPDLYYKIEPFINLNCVNFGINNKKSRVDDFVTLEKRKNNTKKNKDISYYVKYIIDNRKLLDEKQILNDINEWIDNIFGIGQLPEKNKKKSLNFFYKETYEQKINLHLKLKKLLNKNKDDMNIEDIIKKIMNKMDLILSFGQTPYQILNYQHPKYGKKVSNNNEEDFEYELYNGVWNKNVKAQIEIDPLFFIINNDSGIFFLFNKERKIEIIYSTLFDQKSSEKYGFVKCGYIELPHIKFFKKIYVKETKSFYYLLKQKYCISSFEEKDKFMNYSAKDLDNYLNSNQNDLDNNIINYNDYNDNDYKSYYYLFNNKLKNNNVKSESKKLKKNEDYIKIITCRYLDKSFKIHIMPKSKSSNKKESMTMSFFCEDFVTSCCTISYNKFLVGLKNGKLIQWSIEENYNDIISKKQNKPKIIIKYNKQIQAHKNAINVIEVNHRLGIIITAGNDSYVFIRKIYDLELMTPIKFKTKYIITLAKVSPMNFLYIICFNKNKNKSVIFGYTLNGLLFAKSNYDYYETLDFTKNGNIVTWIHKKEIQVLNSDNLNKIQMKESDKFYPQLDASWVKFTYFTRKNEQDSNIKIISYIFIEKNKTKFICTLDVSKINYFD